MKLLSVEITKVPFHTATLKVRGRTPEASRDLATAICRTLATQLKGAVIWPPTPKGFDPFARQHLCEVSISLKDGDDSADRILEALCD